MLNVCCFASTSPYEMLIYYTCIFPSPLMLLLLIGRRCIKYVSQCYHLMCKMLLNHVYMYVCIDGCVYLPLRCSYSTLAVSLYAFLFVSVSLNRLLTNTHTRAPRFDQRMVFSLVYMQCSKAQHTLGVYILRYRASIILYNPKST